MVAIPEEMESLCIGDLTECSWKRIRDLELQLDRLLSLEEFYWQQRMRSDWFEAGDRNTKLFHRKASLRNAKNEIKGFEDGEGTWRCGDDEVASIIESHFGDIFTSSDPVS